MEDEPKKSSNAAYWGRIFGLWITLLVMFVLTALVVKFVQYINSW